MDLSRYIDAQSDPAEGYSTALREILTTGKQSHWMWYIFPQLDGLGRSTTARYFAMADLEEAANFLNHPVLGVRLLEISEAIVARLHHGSDLLTLMNSRIDAQKLVSCMTLFGGLAARAYNHEPQAQAARVILNAAMDEGLRPCTFTADRLTSTPPPTH